jgi:hypothetical protein
MCTNKIVPLNASTINITEVGLALLAHASMLLNFWDEAFQK